MRDAPRMVFLVEGSRASRRLSDPLLRAAIALGEQGGTAVGPAHSQIELDALSWCCHHGGRAEVVWAHWSDRLTRPRLEHLASIYAGRFQFREVGVPDEAPEELLGGAQALVTCSRDALRDVWQVRCQHRGIPVLDLMADPEAVGRWLASRVTEEVPA